MKQNIKTIIRTIGGILGIAISVFFLTFFVLAWTGPQHTPPTCESGEVGCDEVLHTGTAAQEKVGGLLLNTGGATNGLIVENGNVGIGTANPGVKLHVNGTITTETGNYFTENISTEFTGTNRAVVNFGRDDIGGALVVNDIDGAKHALTTGGSDLTFIKHKADSNDWHESFVIQGDDVNNYPQGYSFYTGTTEKVRIDSSGNIGIGTTSPGYKLDVSGDIHTTGNVLTDSGAGTFIPLSSPVAHRWTYSANTAVNNIVPGGTVPANAKALYAKAFAYQTAGAVDHVVHLFGPDPISRTESWSTSVYSNYTTDWGSFAIVHEGDASGNPNNYGAWDNGIINLNSNGNFCARFCHGYSAGTHTIVLQIWGYWI